MRSMYEYPDMQDYVEVNLESICRPVIGYRCRICGLIVERKRSMGNAKGAMVAHLKGEFNALNPNPPQFNGVD